MSVSDRAAAVPSLQTALNDSEVHDALRRAGSAGRDIYRRARGKSPGKALKEKRLRRTRVLIARTSSKWKGVA
jgi:hypothetical protein